VDCDTSGAQITISEVAKIFLFFSFSRGPAMIRVKMASSRECISYLKHHDTVVSCDQATARCSAEVAICPAGYNLPVVGRIRVPASGEGTDDVILPPWCLRMGPVLYMVFIPN